MRYLAWGIVLAGCQSPSFSYNRSSAAKYPAREATCELEVVTLRPTRPFVEIGTFDVQNNYEPMTDTGDVPSVAELLKLVRARACREGADAVLAIKSGAWYVQATALRWVEPAAAPGADEPPPPPAAAP